MKKTRALWFALSIALVSFNASARAGWIVGLGSTDCDDYLRDRHNKDKAQSFEHWMQGMVSAYNNFSVRTETCLGFDHPDPPGKNWNDFVARENSQCKKLPVEGGVKPVLITAVMAAMMETYRANPNPDPRMQQVR